MPSNEIKYSYMDMLSGFNIVSKFASILGTSHYIHPVTGLITQHQTSVDWTRNWLFTNPNPKLYCNLYQEIDKCCGFIPSKCLECYKVVVKLPTVASLFKMYAWQKDFTKDCMYKDRFCKCGIEERPYVAYQYGAYFYNTGVEHGKLRHGQVLRGMQELFGKDNVSDIPGDHQRGKVEVILKRFCTEYELKYGPSNQYKWQPLTKELEDKIMAAFDVRKNVGQPDYLIEHVMENWLRYAWSIGDQTAKEFNNGKPFYAPVVTYHTKENERHE